MSPSVVCNRIIDVLETKRPHGRITVSQYRVGRQVQAVLARSVEARPGSASLGIRGSRNATIAQELAILFAIGDARLVAKLLDEIVSAIGVIGTRFPSEVLTHRQTYAQYAEA